MKRLDVALVEWGFAPSRSKAQQMIAAGEVQVLLNGEWKKALQPSQSVEEKSQVSLIEGETLKYVSRGGLKLEGALEELLLDVTGFRCLDVGLSTGGFADCLLKAGAAQILGIDVGRGQLHPSLQKHPQILSLEELNAKDLPNNSQVLEWIHQGADLCVVDVSFISLDLVLPALGQILPPGCRLLALVKPQFEVGARALNKKGVVSDAALYEEVQGRILLSLKKCGFSLKTYLASRVKGQDGNQEFFAYAVRN